MDKDRILKLAVEALEQQKSKIEADIQALHAELRSTPSRVAQDAIRPQPAVRKRRLRTVAERKAHSQKMKAYWAEKKAKAAKPAARRSKPNGVAKKSSHSLAMKNAWKKRKAAAKDKSPGAALRDARQEF